MYPFENNVAISDCMAGTLPIYALFRFLSFDTETSYQLWWMSCCALNYACACWAFRKMGISVFASAIGAYIFAFGINNLSQFMHLQMNCKFFIPLVLVHLVLFLNSGKLKYFLFCLLAFVLQFYSNVYLALFLSLFVFLFLAIYLPTNGRLTKLKQVISARKLVYLSLSFIAAVGLILLVALPYYWMNAGTPLQYDYISYNLPNLYSYFFTQGNVLFWDILKSPPIKEGPLWYLHELFPGLFVYLGFLSALGYFIYWLIKDRKGFPIQLILLMVSLGFIILFSRDAEKNSLFFYIQPLPGFSNLRLPARFMIVMVFGMIWSGVIMLDRLANKKFIWVYILIVPLVLLDNSFELPKNQLRTSSKNRRYRTEVFEHLITLSNINNNSIVAVVNTKSQDDSFQLDVMLATQKLNLYTLNGYSSTCVTELCYAFHDPNHVGLKQWMQRFYMDQNKVTIINF